MIVIASIAGSDRIHELVRDEDGNMLFRTYIRDQDLDRPASEVEAGEFWEAARASGGYAQRGAGPGRERS